MPCCEPYSLVVRGSEPHLGHMTDEPSRRLAAVMFTDMVGYTALMQEDEPRATALRDRHRTVLRECIEAQKGEIVQFYGDGTLSVSTVLFARRLDQVGGVALEAGPSPPDAIIEDQPDE